VRPEKGREWGGIKSWAGLLRQSSRKGTEKLGVGIGRTQVLGSGQEKVRQDGGVRVRAYIGSKASKGGSRKKGQCRKGKGI